MRALRLLLGAPIALLFAVALLGCAAFEAAFARRAS